MVQKKSIVLFFAVFLVVFSFKQDVFAYTDLVDPREQGPDKVFTVTFNQSVDKKSVTQETVFVTDEANERLPGLEFTFHADGTKLKIYNPHRYATGTYTLHLSTDVKDIHGTALKHEVTKEFYVNGAKFAGERTGNELVNWMNEGKTIEDVKREESDHPLQETATLLIYKAKKYDHGACTPVLCNHDKVELHYHFVDGKLDSISWRIALPVSYTFPTLQSYFEFIGMPARSEFGELDIVKMNPYTHEVYDGEFKNKKVRLEYDVNQLQISLSIGDTFEEIEVDEPGVKEPEVEELGDSDNYGGVLFPE